MKNLQRLLILSFLLLVNPLIAQEETPLIYRVNIRENIGSNSWIYLQNGLHEASLNNARAVILHMNTYGGGVMEADSMRSAILNYSLPVYVFIDNNAASAGALISIACDSIFMRNSASIGAATVVEGGSGAAAPDKYQSYMRGIMRATAESHGKKITIVDGDTLTQWRRDPLVAEAMVDEKIVVPGYADSTQILTLTASQAMALGYCEGMAESLHELVVTHLGISDYKLETYNPTFYDKVKGFLTSGVVQALLIMFIIGGIYFELQSPGIGFPTAASITAAILYFAPLYLTGYAQNWEVLLFMLGLIFIVFELFVFPGFGFSGITGIVLIFSSLVLALIGNIRFSLDGVNTLELFRAVMIVLGGMGMGVALIIYLSSRIGMPGFLKQAALHADEEGFVSVPMEPLELVGQTGVAATVLRPSGKVLLGGSYYDAVSLRGFIEKDVVVVVKRYENFQLYVMRKES
ncbi:MAG: NfeD family protein [Proteiniphilum sp.]|jgi:membrane-bound serine protease (ClpP class)|nr:NfeD family protein [Proteiniphilum sp.]MDD2726232.1 NfeD family protein [Proteiniphilum sp.]MDD3332751.1 NfeD family protein [Proteiniphilum sp.]MDD3556155.1 NfeD family protein [Proteiniphilum sp.]MDD3979772.1 NfeD family protein [Proteiniphilum sp.]